MNLQPSRLLAKRLSPGNNLSEEATLAGHTREVLRAVETFLGCHRVHLSSTFRLPEEQVLRLSRLLRISALLHDLGKANSQFQKLIRGERLLQAVRHEQISYRLAQEIICLIGDLSRIDQQMISYAILGHHRQYPDSTNRSGCGREIELYQHGDFEHLLSSIGMHERPNLPSKFIVSGGGGLSRILKNQEMVALQEFNAWDSDERLILGILKNSLILADILGSVVGREIDVQAWSRSAWSNVCSEEDMRSIAMKRLNGQSPRSFQAKLRKTNRRLTLVEAGCGSGKTVGAYLWAERHAVGRKLFFCYPTMGTATEGYRDYVHEADAALSHSRVTVDLEILGLRDQTGEVQDKLQVARAICEWHPKIISCTVDLVLGIIHNAYASICAWPSLINGAFVFDEIHSYDKAMWKSLLKFIQTFHAPILLMSASLPRERRRELESLAKIDDDSIEIISGPQDIEWYPRYRHQSNDTLDQTVRDYYAQGKHILWVTNTVDRCLKTAKSLSDLSPHVYHSRFRYRDRVHRHREVIDAFRRDGASIAVCTQVAEMSLDISADLMISDLAPVPSLIQRLGRLNRRASPDRPSAAAPFIIVCPEQYLPYEEADLNAASEWIRKLGFKKHSQYSLSLAWNSELAYQDTIFIEEWLNGGMYTKPGPFREGSNTLSFIFEADMAFIQASIACLPEWIIPMIPPRQYDWQNWSHFGYARIAPVECMKYDPYRGAEWVEKSMR